MSTAYPNAPDLTPDDYLLVGVATCFVKQDGEVSEITLLEPIPSAYAESVILSKIPTSYQVAFGTSLGQVLQGDQPQRLEAFPEGASFCEEFAERAFAAARTYHRNPQVKTHVPQGDRFTDFNYSTQPKRVVNAETVVRVEDNVKQHEYTHKVL